MKAYLRELAAKSPIDIVIYNIPAFANESIVRNLLKSLHD
jgi:dihydrodipicolinate synthase/N-acetylneuraminate lyase